MVQAAVATIPVTASTSANQTSTMRRLCWRAQTNSLIGMPANSPVTDWYS